MSFPHCQNLLRWNKFGYVAASGKCAYVNLEGFMQIYAGGRETIISLNTSCRSSTQKPKCRRFSEGPKKRLHQPEHVVYPPDRRIRSSLASAIVFKNGYPWENLVLIPNEAECPVMQVIYAAELCDIGTRLLGRLTECLIGLISASAARSCNDMIRTDKCRVLAKMEREYSPKYGWRRIE
ncbi:hypothetical protein K432DRAFT_222149 [Lepidopterella palustris CBS 459.81]|uniref:Uncharacterized protein n=1 Tax=Lepidopterella palustris CBS 459.81 TaxID=1314670 RepID=A0A8E2J920_9PEZI|nr:hypothetical protein K432DRAFT_222149 [Lepidopterella palustris CBS 459.81]